MSNSNNPEISTPATTTRTPNRKSHQPNQQQQRTAKKNSNTSERKPQQHSTSKRPVMKHHVSAPTTTHQANVNNQAVLTPGVSTTGDRFAWSSYQSAPDANEVPKPSLKMLANAKQVQLSWAPKSLPASSILPTTAATAEKQHVQQEEPQNVFQNDTTQEMTVNLMKMLGIGQI
jgi:hypothetical protein